MLVCVAALSAVGAAIRCTDAAREAARLAARGDEQSAAAAARRIAPTGAQLQLRRDGGFVVVTVTSGSVLPGIAIEGHAISAAEVPGSSQ